MFKLIFRRLLALIIFSSISLPFFSQNLQGTLGSQITIPPNYFGFNGANVVRAGNPSYNTPWLIDSIGLFGPEIIRYPAGVPSGFWDWQKGTLYQNPPGGFLLPREYDGYIFKTNTLDMYKSMVDLLGLTPLQNINVLCSDPYYETARLYYSRGINLPVKYIEFGNELYDDEYPQYLQKWPTANAYIDDMNNFASVLRSFPGSNEFKIAAVGAVNRLGLEPAESRRNTWTSIITSNASADIDAITLHCYIGTGLDENVALSLSNLPQVLSTPFKRMDDLSNIELAQLRNAGKEAWITEYNVFDKKHCIHSTWAQGLMAASMTLSFLNDSTIKLINFHSMVADGVWGSIFKDSSDLDISTFYNGVTCTTNPPQAKPQQRSGCGNAMLLVGQALKGSASVRKISLTNNPVLYDVYNSVHGWQFDGPIATQGIFLNLSGTIRTVVINQADWDLSGYKFEQISVGPGGPLALITGNATKTPGVNDVETSGFNNFVGQTIVLKPYSVFRLVKPKTGLLMKVVDNTICSGTTTSLVAQGTGNFSWTPMANLISLKPDNSVMQFTATVTNTTVYTVTVTAQNGITSSVTITVYPKPKLNATATLSNTCKNLPVKLAATFTGGNTSNFNSFIWLPSTEVDNPFSDVVNVNPKKTTTYTVYATDGQCWSSVDSVKVNVSNNADATDSRLVCRDSLPLKLSTKVNKYKYVYNWYKNGVLLGTGKNIFVSPDTITTYMMVMQSTIDSYCVDTDFVTITPITCCGSKDASMLTFGPIIKMSEIAVRIKKYCDSTANGVATLYGVNGLAKEIVINGQLIVDSDYTFTNCSKIKFGENADVLFPGEGAHLNFQNCKISAAECSGRMWNGFSFSDWTESLTLNNTTISDAKIAIKATLNAQLVITNCVFNNNYIGLDIATMESTFNPVIYGDSFIYSALLPPYENQKPFAGIKLNDIIDITIGKAGYPSNVFLNSSYGIYAENAHVYLYNNIFRNILNTNNGDVNEGSAVYANNLNGYGDVTNPNHIWEELSVVAGSTTAANTFDNCFYGINAINHKLKVNYNNFNDVNNAISCLGCVKKEISITYNFMDSVGRGINLIEPKLSTIDILNNSILTSTLKTPIANVAAINVSDNVIYPSALDIWNNVVTNYGKYGILVTNNFKPSIKENKVYMRMGTTTESVYALNVLNSDSSKINCNFVGSTNTTLSKRIGLSASFCAGSNFRCNVIDKCYTGMEFWGNCNNSTIKNNELRHLAVGLAVGKSGTTSGIIGPQPVNATGKPTHNLFTGQYTRTSGAGNKKGYFSVAATLAINSILAGGKFDLTRYLVLNGLTSTNDSVQVPYPNSKTGTGTAMTPFYTFNTPVTCDVNCTMQTAKLNMNNADDNSDDDFVDVKELLRNNMDALAFEKEPVIQYSLKKNIYALQNNEGNKYTVAAQLHDITSMMQKLSSVNNDDVEKIVIANSSINTTEKFEVNDQALNDLELKYMMKKQKCFTKPQIDFIFSIASQCPVNGGTAVYRARAMYQTMYPTHLFDDENACNRITENNSTALDNTSLNVEVMPNPTKGLMHIMLSNENETELQMLIADMEGRIVFNSNIAAHSIQKTIDLSALAPQVYMMNIYDNQNNVMCRKKISVVKF